MVTPPKPFTEEDAKKIAASKLARSQFLFDAAHCRYSMLDVTKVACLMNDRIEELERELATSRECRVAAEHEIEQFISRVVSKGIVTP